MEHEKKIYQQLRDARAAQRAMQQKVDGYIGAPNLTADGSPRPSLQERPQRDDARAARASLRGPDMSRTPSNEPSGDAYITGHASRYRRTFAKDWGHDDDLDAREEKGAVITRRTRLSIPVTRSRRAATPEGVTSFHFNHVNITKTATETTSSSGVKNRPGSARAHARYLERETALATDAEGVVDRIENEFDSGMETASKIEANEIEKLSGRAESGSIYIEREEALAVNTNGVAVLYSNIDPDAGERRKFWNLVEAYENEPGIDAMRVRMAEQLPMWKRVIADPECPQVIRESLAKVNPDRDTRIETEDNELLRHLLKRHGWTPPPRKKKHENQEDYDVRLVREYDKQGITFEDARGGRIQFRIIGELPHETDHEGRVRILRGMAEEFEKRGVPYMAVMHAPDHTNSATNWHFHLIYHDRPARRFTGQAEDHLPTLDARATPYKKRQWEIAAEGLQQTATQAQIGKWDFDVEVSYKQRCRRTVKSRPYAQNKNREVTRKTFVPMLRQRLADLTNEELARVGEKRRLDPRRYSEIGIDRATDEHVGTKLSQREQWGIPTEVGCRNEERQWDYIIASLEQEKAQQEGVLLEDLAAMRRLLTASTPDVTETEDLTQNIARYEAARRAAIEHQNVALHMKELHARAASRASKLEETCEKHIAAIKKKNSDKQERKLETYRVKLAEARDHLAGLEQVMSAEIAQIETSNEIAASLVEEAEKQRRQFYARIEAARSKGDDRGAEGHTSQRVGTEPPVRSITEADLDLFIDTVMHENIRLVRREHATVLKKLDARFDWMFAAPNHGIMERRLDAIRQKQTKAIEDLCKAIEIDPQVIRRERGHLDQEVLRLRLNDKRLQAAFRNFGYEPRIVATVQRALDLTQSEQPSPDPASVALATTQPQTWIDGKPLVRSLGKSSALSGFSEGETGSRNSTEAASSGPAHTPELFDPAQERARIAAGKIGSPAPQREMRAGLHEGLDRWLEAYLREDDKQRLAEASTILEIPVARMKLKKLAGMEADALRGDIERARTIQLERDKRVQQQQRMQEISLGLHTNRPG